MGIKTHRDVATASNNQIDPIHQAWSVLQPANAGYPNQDSFMGPMGNGDEKWNKHCGSDSERIPAVQRKNSKAIKTVRNKHRILTCENLDEQHKWYSIT